MTEETFYNIIKVLNNYYGFDALAITEFVLHYEQISGEKIPDEWMNKI